MVFRGIKDGQAILAFSIAVSWMERAIFSAICAYRSVNSLPV